MSFHHYARRATNPKMTLDRRRYALGECLRTLGNLTHIGGDFFVHRQVVRDRFNNRLGFDEVVSDIERISAAVAAVQAEYNQLQEMRQVLQRRAVSRKARGRRNASARERDATRQYWEAAVMRISGVSLLSQDT